LKSTANKLALLTWLAVTLLVGSARAESVTVRLLTNREVREVRVSAPGRELVDAAGRAAPATDCLVRLTGSEQWATCGSSVLRLPPYRLRFSRSAGLSAPRDATLAFDNQRRRYPGDLEFTPEGEVLRPRVKLDLDLYVAVVLAGETAHDHPEYLKAMAVTIRTYATERLAAGAGPFADSTAGQVFPGLPDGPRAALLEQIARETSGRILRIGGRPAPVFYHACCGGYTRPAAEIWPEYAEAPHLRGVADIGPDGKAWCAKNRWFTWERIFSRQEWSTIMTDLFHADRAKREDEEGPILLSGKTGTQRLAAWPFRLTLCRAGQWSTVPSDRFEIIEETDRLLLHGHGLGHRVGLCQAGALAQAEAGRSAEDILRFYFPGL